MFCTVTPIVAVLPLLTLVGAVKLVTATSVDGAISVTVADAWCSLRSRQAGSAWPRACDRRAPHPFVFQVKVRVVLAPMPSPGIVCVPIVTPAVWSVSTRSKLSDGQAAHVLDGDRDRGAGPLRHGTRRRHAGHGQVRRRRRLHDHADADGVIRRIVVGQSLRGE